MLGVFYQALHLDSFFGEISSSKLLPKVKKISPTEISAIQNTVIRSEMYLHYYERSKPFKVFQLPQHVKLYFIKDSKMIHDLIRLETTEENDYTVRKQRYKYNQSLLDHNPVASASLTSSSYVREQHKLFISLVTGIEASIANISLPNVYPRIESKFEIISFVIGCTAQCYLPMLLNVDGNRVPLILTELIQLLDLLEEATGKHQITFGNYLDSNNCEYIDEYEQRYIRLFHHIVLELKDARHFSKIPRESAMNPQNNVDLEIYCQEIIECLTPDCNIMKVLLTQFSSETESRLIINNILSWIDNMLNVVHTIINFLVLISASERGQQSYDREFYQKNLRQARALATMFMRHVVSDFEISSSNGNVVQFHANDILMMSNGNEDTVFGGEGRKCPSKPWSYLFVDKMIQFILQRYEIQSPSPRMKRIQSDPENKSWFWNKFSVAHLKLLRKDN